MGSLPSKKLDGGLDSRAASPVGDDVRRRLMQFFGNSAQSATDNFCRLTTLPHEELIEQAVVVLEKPYGANYLLALDGGYGTSVAEFRPGQGTSLHFHTRRREAFLVLSGNLSLRHGATESSLLAGNMGVSTPGTAHSLSNEANDDLRVIEMFSPALLSDKIRLADRYDRRLGKVSLRQ
jgi:mannose-6-phosphate isomerase-like protein (cupin superfamily)